MINEFSVKPTLLPSNITNGWLAFNPLLCSKGEQKGRMVVLEKAEVKELYINASEAYYTQIRHRTSINELLSSSKSPHDSCINEILKRINDMEESVLWMFSQFGNVLSPHFGENDQELKDWEKESIEHVSDYFETVAFTGDCVPGHDERDVDTDTTDTTNSNSDSNSANSHCKKQKQPKRKVQNTTKNISKRTNKRAKMGNQVTKPLDRKTLLADSNRIVQGVSQSLVTHPVVAADIRLAEIVISQVKDAFNGLNPRLSRIPVLAKSLLTILQTRSQYKKTMSVALALIQGKEDALDTDTWVVDSTTWTIGSICSRIEKNIKAKEKAEKKQTVPTSSMEVLKQVKRAIHRLKTGENNHDGLNIDKLTKADIKDMKELVKFDQAMENLTLNLLHETMMIHVESNISMYQLFTFEIPKPTDAEHLKQAEDLWRMVNPEMPFDSKTTSMLEYRELVILPALTSNEFEEDAIKVNRNMSIMLTQTKRKGRKEVFFPLFCDAQDLTLDGAKGKCDDDYCGTQKQDTIRSRMAILHHNLSASTSIDQRLPDSLCPHGIFHKLLINAPSQIKHNCNFQSEKFEFFDSVHDEESSIVVKMKKHLKNYDVGENTIFVNSEAQVDSLKLLLEP